MPSAHRPIADETPITPPSSSWPPSHALTLIITSREAAPMRRRLLPRERRLRIGAASREVMIKVSAWLGGQLLLGGVIGVSSAIGLWALGIPFFYVLALIS